MPRLTFACAALLALPLAAAAETVEVTASALNMRSGPSTGSRAVGTATRGQRLEVQGRSGSWVKVRFGSQDAWGYSRYLKTVASSSASTGTAYKVTASLLNVRSGPSTSSSVVGQVRKDQSVTVVGASGDWKQIRYGSGTAWCSGKYLSPATGDSTGGSTGGSTSSGTPYEVNAASLNVRSGPGTNYGRIGALSRGTRVNVIGSSGSWKKIRLSNRDGWVHGNYLRSPGSGDSNPGTLPTSSVGFVQLPNSGRGFYGYYSASRRWGTPRMVYGIIRISGRFIDQNPNAPRLGFGDISLQNGGDISGHASHERGVDVDARPVRNDRGESPVTIHQSGYSRSLTQKALDLFVAELPVTHIFFNDPNTRHTQHWPNHDNHFHVRISR